MTISTDEERLVAAFRKLPAETAEQLSALIGRLAALSPGSRIDWSDEWSDEDLQRFTVASAARIDSDDGEQGC
jgi:hypothetical protein